MSRTLLFSLLLSNIFCLVIGQILWKHAMQSMTSLSIIRLVSSPGIWAGGILYIIATALWLLILKNAALSYVYPLQSLAYVLGIFAGWWVFRETIPWTRWLGMIVIMAGVWLITMSSSGQQGAQPQPDSQREAEPIRLDVH